MITTWDKNGKIIHQDTSDDDYAMWAADLSTYGIAKTKGKFPEDGCVLTNRGVYRQKTITERVEEGSVRLSATQKLEGNNVVNKTPQEQVDDGTITLKDYKIKGYMRIADEANTYMTSATTSHGYLVNNDAQKIAIFSFSTKEIPDADPDKKAYLAAGILYPLDKAREILDFCASMKGSVDAANTAIKNALSVAAVDAVKFSSFI